MDPLRFATPDKGGKNKGKSPFWGSNSAMACVGLILRLLHLAKKLAAVATPPASLHGQ
ncbi:unnamed protein product [Linum tenue]|uniref:Uncharacterized protein n=1 Tax=Linum tenue TaxID=586396 RepID=A0AAV0P2T3_9ROSI|nr:unnamed protein product [Linum tenue]